LQLKVFGENIYDNIIYFAPSTEKHSSISSEDIIEFSNEGGNLLFALSRETSDYVRDIVETFGITLDKKGTEVIDHFEGENNSDFRLILYFLLYILNFFSKIFLTISLQHVNFLARNYDKASPVIGRYSEITKELPVVFHGIGHSIEDNNILAVKLLKGNPSTYSASPNRDAIESSGEKTLLVTAIQARNNARVLISGSIEMFSNSFFSNSNAGNELFCNEISKWAFGESGVLRFRDILHHKSDGSPPDVILHEKVRPDLPQSLYPDPEITRNSLVYRIKDDIVYSMIVEEYSNGNWKPFSANDLQMEFVMLDPHVRKTMTCDPVTGKFIASFVAPDNYGVFKFRVLYRRPGYSVLHAETQVSIRPFKHDEYERFIFSAYPYYTSALSATVAFLIFSVLFLFSSETSMSK
jgi:oligosaccharyltransferase complex subunit beta